MKYSRRIAGGLLILQLAVAGCARSVDRQPLTGKITYDGRPLAYGQITFSPDHAKGASGPQGAGEIRDGAYKTSPDYGPVPGPNIVRITGWNSAPEQGMLGQPVISEYTSSIDVSKTSTTFDFDIPAVKRAR